jgi:hypothetical protein
MRRDVLHRPPRDLGPLDHQPGVQPRPPRLRRLRSRLRLWACPTVARILERGRVYRDQLPGLQSALFLFVSEEGVDGGDRWRHQIEGVFESEDGEYGEFNGCEEA